MRLALLGLLICAGCSTIQQDEPAEAGSVGYTQNDRRSTFNSFIADVRGRFARTAFIDVSYTRSSSQHDTQV